LDRATQVVVGRDHDHDGEAGRGGFGRRAAGTSATAQALGDYLTEMTTLIRSRPLLVVVLAPPAHLVATGEARLDYLVPGGRQGVDLNALGAVARAGPASRYPLFLIAALAVSIVPLPDNCLETGPRSAGHTSLPGSCVHLAGRVAPAGCWR
jgi:hypothetical protein